MGFIMRFPHLILSQILSCKKYNTVVYILLMTIKPNATFTLPVNR